MKECKKVTPQQKAQLRRKWKRWVEVITRQVINLLVAQHIFKEIGGIIGNNPKIQVGSEFYTWIKDNYVAQIGTTIRRLAEPQKKRKNYKHTISLHILLQNIAENPDAITKDYLAKKRYSGCPKHARSQCAQRDFAIFAESGATSVSVGKINKDLKILKNKTCRIKTFVTQWIAHWDSKKSIRRLPTFKEFEETIKLLEQLTIKYRGLITSSHAPTLMPIMPDWKKPLRYAWIEKDK